MNNFFKKNIGTVMVFLFGIPLVATATLYEYYHEQNLPLPHVSERAIEAQNAGISDYTGTSDQNIAFEDFLRGSSEIDFFTKLRDFSAEEGIFGAINFVQVQDMFLSGSGVTSGATSVTLNKFKYPNGDIVVMNDFGDIGYGTHEPNTSREENISFTGITQSASGKATLTGVSRGLGLSFPYTASSSLQFAHAGGTVFRITNSAPFYNELLAKKNANEVFGNFTISSTTSSLVKLCFKDCTNYYLWHDSTTGSIGYASSSSEFIFSADGTTFTTNDSLFLTTGVLGINTTTPLSLFESFTIDSRGFFSISTTTGEKLDNFWNDRYNATTTKEVFTIASSTINRFTSPSSTIALLVMDNATTSASAIFQGTLGGSPSTTANFAFFTLGNMFNEVNYIQYREGMTSGGSNQTVSQGDNKLTMAVTSGAGTGVGFAKYENTVDTTKDFDFNFNLDVNDMSAHHGYFGVGCAFSTDCEANAQDDLDTWKEDGAGFLVYGAATILEAYVGNGTVRATSTNLISFLTISNANDYRVRRVGSEINFYLNNTLRATLTSNLPDSADEMIAFNLSNITTDAGSIVFGDAASTPFLLINKK